MLHYIILTYFASFLGALLYALFGPKFLRPAYRKSILIGIIVWSLVFPYFLMQNELAQEKMNDVRNDLLSTMVGPSPVQETSHSHPHYTVSQYIYEEYCPSEGAEFQICYEQAIAVSHFCNCPEITRDNLLMYKEKPVYNFWLNHKDRVHSYLLILGGFLLAITGGKFLFLIYLVWTSKKESIFIAGKQITVLYPKFNRAAAGSFYLLKPYILWQKEMFLLDEKEKQAILLHEFAHLKQKDTWLKTGLELIKPIWFFNIVYYYFAKELNRLNEYLADEFTLRQTGDPVFYAGLLLKMKSFQTNYSLVTHFSSSKKELYHRVSLILNAGNNQDKRKSVFAIPVVLLLFFSLALSEYLSLPTIEECINNQEEKIEFYEKLSTASRTKGQQVFCKYCHLDAKN